MMTNDPGDHVSTLPFRDAMTELREILDQIEGEDADLDALSDLVERAASLIRLCRQRIVRTEMKVQEIIDQLEDDLQRDESS